MKRSGVSRYPRADVGSFEADVSDAAAVRAQNTARCGVALRDHGSATVTEVASRTGLSRPTVENCLATLIERGLVHEAEDLTVGGRGAGRPARKFEFRARAGHVVGIDVGLHRIRVAVADLAGSIIGLREDVVGVEISGADRLKAVNASVSACLGDADIAASTVTALGVAVSGFVGNEGRIVVSRNLPEWEGVDLHSRLGAGFDCPMVVDNDIRLAALAEHRMGAARLVDDVLYLFAGHRVSMGLIIDGRLRRGHHGASGEIGELLFSEQVYERGQLRWTSASEAEEVFRLAADGDAAAVDEIERFAGRVATGLATVTMALDPDVIVVGGGLSRAGDVLLGPLRQAVAASIDLPVRPRFVASGLGAESVVLGALARAFAESSRHVFGVRGLPDPVIETVHLDRFISEGRSAARGLLTSGVVNG